MFRIILFLCALQHSRNHLLIMLQLILKHLSEEVFKLLFFCLKIAQNVFCSVFLFKNNICHIKSVPFRGVNCSDAAGKQFGYSALMDKLKISTTGRLWDEDAKSPYFTYTVSGISVATAKHTSGYTLKLFLHFDCILSMELDQFLIFYFPIFSNILFFVVFIMFHDCSVYGRKK